MPLLPEVRHIAVLRANGIGDLMFALPALDALRAAYPQAIITLLATPWHRSFLAGRAAPVDEVVVVPPSLGVRNDSARAEDPAALDLFFAKMRRRHFDLALQMHGGGANSNPFVARLGARTTAGLRSAGAPRLDHEIPYLYYQSEVMRLLEVVGLVGADPVNFEPKLPAVEADVAEARSALPGGDSPPVVIHPGAGDPRRRWPTKAFAAVADALSRAGAAVAVVGSGQDAPLTEAVVSAMREPAVDLAGRLSLGGLAGLASISRVVVSNDSGPLHLAAAVGAPTVGIFWCGNMINAGPAYRTRHRPQISWRLECPICGVDCTRSHCSHDASFVAEVPVEAVNAAALELFEAESAPVPRARS